MTPAPVVLGIDFGASKIAVAASALDGTRLASRTVPTRAHSGARAVFDRGVAAARGLLTGAPAGRALAAVGVSTVGIPFDDRVELAPTIPGWEQFALGHELRAAFADGWEVEEITADRFEVLENFPTRPHAWLAKIVRVV